MGQLPLHVVYTGLMMTTLSLIKSPLLFAILVNQNRIGKVFLRGALTRLLPIAKKSCQNDCRRQKAESCLSRHFLLHQGIMTGPGTKP
jgi:hypothetical protein